MEKIEALKSAVARGYFSRDDAEPFGKAALWIGPSHMQALGIEEGQAKGHFYQLHALDVEPEVIRAGLDMGLIIRDENPWIIFSFM